MNYIYFVTIRLQIIQWAVYISSNLQQQRWQCTCGLLKAFFTRLIGDRFFYWIPFPSRYSSLNFIIFVRVLTKMMEMSSLNISWYIPSITILALTFGHWNAIAWESKWFWHRGHWRCPLPFGKFSPNWAILVLNLKRVLTCSTENFIFTLFLIENSLLDQMKSMCYPVYPLHMLFSWLSMCYPFTARLCNSLVHPNVT